MGNTPKTKKVRELQAQAGAAKLAPTIFEYNGDTYKVPAQMDWPMEVLELMDGMEESPSQMMSVVKMIMGEKQYTDFKKRNNRIGALVDLFKAISSDEASEGVPNS